MTNDTQLSAKLNMPPGAMVCLLVEIGTHCAGPLVYPGGL